MKKKMARDALHILVKTKENLFCGHFGTIVQPTVQEESQFRLEISSTNIIYHTRTSWGVVSRILKTMQQQKLISAIVAGRRASYALTEKGIGVLNTYKNIVS